MAEIFGWEGATAEISVDRNRFPSKADGGSVIDPADIAAKELGDLQRNWKIRIKSDTSSLTFLTHALLSKRSALRVSPSMVVWK